MKVFFKIMKRTGVACSLLGVMYLLKVLLVASPMAESVEYGIGSDRKVRIMTVAVGPSVEAGIDAECVRLVMESPKRTAQCQAWWTQSEIRSWLSFPARSAVTVFTAVLEDGAIRVTEKQHEELPVFSWRLTSSLMVSIGGLALSGFLRKQQEEHIWWCARCYIPSLWFLGSMVLLSLYGLAAHCLMALMGWEEFLSHFAGLMFILVVVALFVHWIGVRIGPQFLIQILIRGGLLVSLFTVGTLTLVMGWEKSRIGEYYGMLILGALLVSWIAEGVICVRRRRQQ